MMQRYGKIALLLVFSLSLIWIFMLSPDSGSGLPELSEHYVEVSAEKIQAQNLLTPIVVSLRGFDTFGEIIVLFLATTAVSFLVRQKKEQSKSRKMRYIMSTVVSQSGVSILQPLLFIFGAYIFSFGHLDPGGGFQGGVILASGFVLWLLVHPEADFRYGLLSGIEAASGYAIVILGLMGLYFLGSFLDLSYLPSGEMGKVLSTGAIPIVYIFIGIKVGVEMMKIISNFRD